MHEFGITENIVKIALDKANEVEAARISQINLVVGELTGFSPDSILFYFDFFSKDTIAEKATLHFESPPARFRCRNCSTNFFSKDSKWDCPECHSRSIEILGGRELYIESLEVE